MLFDTLCVSLMTLVAFCNAESCKLTLQDDLNIKKEPLFLRQKGKSRWSIVRLEVEETRDADRRRAVGVIHLRDRETLAVLCSGRRNFLAKTGEQASWLYCDDGKLTVDGERVKDSREDLACSRIAESTARVTDTRCAQGSNIVEIGFEFKDIWVPEIEICHNLKGMYSLYARHKVYGNSLEGGTKDSDRSAFSKGDDPRLYSGSNPEIFYQGSTQKRTFKQILGPRAGTKFIKGNNYLARGHLAPDADFAYNSEQRMTYYYVNVAPQWQLFNQGNWKSIENAVRSIAVEKGYTLEVYTGTHGVLELQYQDGKPKPIYLNANKKTIPVPEVFWKLVRHHPSKACTVAVGVNNLFFDSSDSGPASLCSDPVDPGWFDKKQNENLKDPSRGHVYFCTYSGFKQAVPTVPSVSCKGLLR